MQAIVVDVADEEIGAVRRPDGVLGTVDAVADRKLAGDDVDDGDDCRHPEARGLVGRPSRVARERDVPVGWVEADVERPPAFDDVRLFDLDDRAGQDVDDAQLRPPPNAIT